MSFGSIMAWTAGTLCGGLAAAVLMRRKSVAAWFFVGGMLVFAAESFFLGLNLSEVDLEELGERHFGVFVAKSLSPFFWLAFSLTYLRGEPRKHLHRWRIALVIALAIPAGVVLGFRNSLMEVLPVKGGGWWIQYFAPAGALTLIVLLSSIVILMNLEKTLRAAIGTARWKIKFAMLGLGLIFGARVYTASQTLLFSGYGPQTAVLETSALLAGCILMGVALVRQGFGTIDIYPSRAVIQGSVTLILAGVYLFVVGVLAQVAAALGGGASFQFQAVVVVAGVATLAVLLFSDRLRQRIRAFVARHFRRPQHDSRALWSSFTHRLSSVTDPRIYCAEAVKLIAESFQVLSVTIWLADDRKDALRQIVSTLAHSKGAADTEDTLAPAAPVLDGLLGASEAFDLDRSPPLWAKGIEEASPSQFGKGGGRYCFPLIAAGRALGAIILVDRVDAIPYSDEELDLLKCIGDQVAAGLFQFQITHELMQAKEIESFQSMSAFFVHDLKNAASSLGLMLQNLPVHFDDPDFRADAFRGIASHVSRINQITGRLGSLREKMELNRVPTDLKALVEEALAAVGTPDDVELVRNFQPVPPVLADREQLGTVVTNLLLNAREAMARGGRLTVEISRNGDRAVISITDTGCGMTAEFIQNSLFRPFRTTKKKGLGIGMFQCRMIVTAHQGNIQVESNPGMGSVFHVFLPLTPKHS
jgi:putative PEP-CTERM system histidine kinase